MTDRKEYMRQWRQNNKRRIRENARKYYKNNPERFQKYTKTCQVEWKARNPDKVEKMKRDNVARRFDTRAAQREALAGRPKPIICEACGGAGERIVFDHCHTKGHFRGWICDSCNLALGMLKDNPERLRKLATYLENDRG